MKAKSETVQMQTVRHGKGTYQKTPNSQKSFYENRVELSIFFIFVRFITIPYNILYLIMKGVKCPLIIAMKELPLYRWTIFIDSFSCSKHPFILT
jgi:hypothetical protein